MRNHIAKETEPSKHHFRSHPAPASLFLVPSMNLSCSIFPQTHGHRAAKGTRCSSSWPSAIYIYGSRNSPVRDHVWMQEIQYSI